VLFCYFYKNFNQMKKTTLFKNLLILTFTLFASLTVAQKSTDSKGTIFGKKPNPESINPYTGHIRCVSSEYEKYLQEKYPKRLSDAQFEAWITPLIENYRNMQSVSSQTGGIITIPVVVHVIHNGQAVGVAPNITDAQVESQITVMNNDFRRLAGTPGFNTNAVGADTQIQFALAKQDPNGNPTNGINRVNLCQPSWSTAAINGTVKPTTIWDPTLYLNMWSVNFTDNTLLGYAQFPDASGLQGLNASGGAATTDGVVANYSAFGSINYNDGTFLLNAPYNAGRTMTHEVGHWIGLRHIWGDGNCTVDDFCADTPNAGAPNYGCPVGTNSCTGLANPGVDMIENYMDYTDDSCMNIFTQNQKDRMVVIMNNAARRASLKTSTKDVLLPLFANDAEVKIENICTTAVGSCTTPNPASPLKVISLYNRGTATLTSATISYNMNGGANSTNNWTGSLAPNKFAYITLPNTAVNGTLNVSITSANGNTDQRATNNTASKAFGNPLSYANSTTFTFNLVGDSYGSEVSWTLKNQAGTTLYSGGPYTDITTGTQVLVSNQTWTLPANGCYYLTMNDAWGDGLYDGVSQGFYTITSGATTLVNVPDFNGPSGATANPVSKLSYFTNNLVLSNDEYSQIEEVVLYPNPTNDFFTIDVPQSFERSGKIEIYNYLGQIMDTKTVTSDEDLKVNVSNLPNGVYIINLNLGNATKAMRLIKE
jgi:hypothetical protein